MPSATIHTVSGFAAVTRRGECVATGLTADACHKELCAWLLKAINPHERIEIRAAHLQTHECGALSYAGLMLDEVRA